MGAVKPTAYDLSRYQRLIGVEDGRVTGKFLVLGGLRRNASYVTTVEVTAWYDDEHRNGMVFYSDDFTVKAEKGEVGFPRVPSDNHRALVEELADEFKAAVLAVAREFERGWAR